MIETTADLTQVAQDLEKETAIAVDVESDSMYHFKERVCLIQLATRDKTIVLDPIKIKDISCLKPVFSTRKTEKVFHGADYDIRSLYRDFHFEIAGLFDTQMAAAFLGLKETSLEALLANRFDIRLNKKYQKKDWSKRPLSGEMLSYAAMDVVYLLPLANQLREELHKKSRMSWVEEETDLLSKVRPASANNGPLFQKFRGAGKLNPRSLAVLESLLTYRNNMAEKKDRPLYQIIHNTALMSLATAMPSDIKRLTDCGALSPKQIRVYGHGVVKAIQRALNVPEDKLPKYPRKKRPIYKPGVSAKVKALKLWREERANSLELDPAIIFNNALLGILATLSPDTMKDLENIQELKKWQIAEFGVDILYVLKKQATERYG